MFQMGEIVFLSSGGPRMKVIGHSPAENVWVEWTDGDGQLQEASFHPAMLEKVIQPSQETLAGTCLP